MSHSSSVRRLASGAVVLAVALAGTSPTFASFVAIDTFDNKNLDTINGQGDWYTQGKVTTHSGTVYSHEDIAVTLDPSGSGSQVLEFPGYKTGNNDQSFRDRQAINSHSALSLSAGETGTLFFQAQMNQGTHLWVALSPVGTESNGGIFHNNRGALLGLGGAGTSNILRVRDAGNNNVTVANYAEGHWYNIWMVVERAADGTGTYDVYLQSDTDTNFLTQTKVTSTPAHMLMSGASTNDPEWSVTAAEMLELDLSHVVVSVGNNGEFGWLNNLYFDGSGANLVNPIPEPASLALLGLGGMMMLGRRRRQLA